MSAPPSFPHLTWPTVEPGGFSTPSTSLLLICLICSRAWQWQWQEKQSNAPVADVCIQVLESRAAASPEMEKTSQCRKLSRSGLRVLHSDNKGLMLQGDQIVTFQLTKKGERDFPRNDTDGGSDIREKLFPSPSQVSVLAPPVFQPPLNWMGTSRDEKTRGEKFLGGYSAFPGSPSLVAAEAAGMAPVLESQDALPSPNWPVCFAISDSCLSWGGLFFTPLNEVLLYWSLFFQFEAWKVMKTFSCFLMYFSLSSFRWPVFSSLLCSL